MLTISNLKNSPEFYHQVIELINLCFKYDRESSFAIDFYPLINTENHDQNLILLEGEELIGHIGYRIRTIKINSESYNFALIGGISIAPKRQGKGHFKYLIHETIKIIQTKEKVAAHTLWSDQLELYKKFDFHLCGEQLSLPQHNNKKIHGYTKTKLRNLELKHKKQIYKLFSKVYSGNILTFERKETWKYLERIISSDLYIKLDEDKNIQAYFFQNKGKDLKNVIYELGSNDNIENEIKHINEFAEVWLPPSFSQLNIKEAETQYLFHLKIGRREQFTSLCENLTNNLIKITSIDYQSITFKFENQSLTQEKSEFLQGVFGPNRFEELSHLPQIYITGLDSL